MEYLFLLGRVCYGGFFVLAGINHFQNLGMLAGFAQMNGVPAATGAVGASGALVLIGGLSVLLGYQPTIGVACLVLFLVPVSFMMHKFWKDTDPMARINNQVNFQKNVALLGAGLMLLLVPQPWPFALG